MSVWVILISISMGPGAVGPVTGEIHTFSSKAKCEAWSNEFSDKRHLIFTMPCVETKLDS